MGSNCRTEVDAAVGNDVGKEWYAFLTLPRHEKSVASYLDEFHIERFLPTYKKVSTWQNRQKKSIEYPLFPQYIFAHIPLSQRIQILRTPGVRQVICRSGRPIPVPDCEIGIVRYTVQHQMAHPSTSANWLGQKVVIERGPLAGVEGMVIRTKTNGMHVLITLRTIQQSMLVEVTDEDLETLMLAEDAQFA